MIAPREVDKVKSTQTRSKNEVLFSWTSATMMMPMQHDKSRTLDGNSARSLLGEGVVKQSGSLTI